MKDFKQGDLEASWPLITVKEGVEFCLKRLYEDQEHSTTDNVVAGLTYEELIGVLRLVQREVRR